MTLLPEILPVPDWRDLVDDALARIPRTAPTWTDHNAHDPGVTILELLSWLVETDVFSLGQTGDRLRRKLLELAGSPPTPVAPAEGAVSLRATPGAGVVTLPAGTVLAARDTPSVRFTTRRDVTASGLVVEAVQTFSPTGYVDRSAMWRSGTPFPAFGADPDASRPSALMLGLTGTPGPPPGPVSFWFWLHGATGTEARKVLGETPPPHHGVTTRWEWLDAGGWRPFPSAAVEDGTRSMTLDGPVVLRLPTGLDERRVGVVARPMRWIRCTVVDGRHDEAPMVRRIALDTVGVSAGGPLHGTLRIAAGVVTPPVLTPGWTGRLGLRFDPAGVVRQIGPVPTGGLPVTVLGITPPTDDAEGLISVTAVMVGLGDGEPFQALPVTDRFLETGTVTVTGYEASGASRWTVVENLDSSTRADRHVTLDATAGELRFGDGERGRTLTDGTAVLLQGRTAPGRAAALTGGATLTLSDRDDALNSVVLGADPATLRAKVAAIVLPEATEGAADPEGLAAAEGRLLEEIGAHERLVDLAASSSVTTLDALRREDVDATVPPGRATTLIDHERIALATPGTRIARVRAWASTDPRNPGLDAPGCVTVVVLPALPDARPEPTPGLVGAVTRWLWPRRVVGTRLFVTGPTYCTVTVTVTVRACAGVGGPSVESAVRDALDTFLHPLRGGQVGTGWPFGRDVYRSEVSKVVDDAAGVDGVIELGLATEGGEPVCGNLCLGPLTLPIPGAHVIEVITP